MTPSALAGTVSMTRSTCSARSAAGSSVVTSATSRAAARAAPRSRICCPSQGSCSPAIPEPAAQIVSVVLLALLAIPAALTLAVADVWTLSCAPGHRDRVGDRQQLHAALLTAAWPLTSGTWSCGAGFALAD